MPRTARRSSARSSGATASRRRLLSGHDEALMTFRGVTAGRAIEPDTLIVDVGGGSTELVLGGPGRRLLPHEPRPRLRSADRAVRRRPRGLRGARPRGAARPRSPAARSASPARSRRWRHSTSGSSSTTRTACTATCCHARRRRGAARAAGRAAARGAAPCSRPRAGARAGDRRRRRHRARGARSATAWMRSRQASETSSTARRSRQPSCLPRKRARLRPAPTPAADEVRAHRVEHRLLLEARERRSAGGAGRAGRLGGAVPVGSPRVGLGRAGGRSLGHARVRWPPGPSGCCSGPP